MGSRTLMRVLPRLSQRITPSWDSTMCWQMESPSPVFFFPAFVLKKGSKILSLISVDTPPPLTMMEISTQSSGSIRVTAISMMPRSSTASTLLMSRLTKTCFRLFSSPKDQDFILECGKAQLDGLLPDLVVHQKHDLVDDARHAQGLHGDLPDLGKRQKAPDDFPDTAELALDLRQSLRVWIVQVTALEKVDIVEDHAQRVADLVRHPRGQLCNGGYLFRPQEVVLEVAVPGDVLYDQDRAQVLVVVVLERENLQTDKPALPAVQLLPGVLGLAGDLLLDLHSLFHGAARKERLNRLLHEHLVPEGQDLDRREVDDGNPLFL